MDTSAHVEPGSGVGGVGGAARLIRNVPAARVLGAGLLLGIALDVLFHGNALGVSFPLFVAMLLGTLVVLSRLDRVLPVQRSLWLVVPLMFYATMVFVRANGFLTFLNVSYSLALLVLITTYFAGGWLARLPLLGYVFTALRVAFEALSRPAGLVESGVDFSVVRQRSGRGVAPVIRGLIIAAPIVLVFALLLASADLMFQRYARDLIDLAVLDELARLLRHGVVVFAAAWLLAGGLAFALRQRDGDTDDTSDAVDVAIQWRPRILGGVEASTVLVAVNALFAMFVWVQFAYLFGGEANIDAAGFTYAEYARRGFFELVAVAILTLAMVLGLSTVTRRESATQRRVFSVLGTIMAGLVLVMLASAFKRLTIYEAAFGFTELRLLSHVFMVWLAAVFVWCAATLWWRPDRFAIGAFACALGFLVTLNVINPDAFIVRQNMARFAATGKLDVPYLSRRSADAVPEIAAALEHLPEAEQAEMADRLQRRYGSAAAAEAPPWPSFHLARARAALALEDLSVPAEPPDDVEASRVPGD